MEDGGASHLRDGPLIIHGAISTPIEGENHHCEPESYTCSPFSVFCFSSHEIFGLFDEQWICVPCDIVSNYGQRLRMQR